MTRPVKIARVQAWAMRCPIKTPVVTSFGIMTNRPTVFVRIEDDDGAFGWGEIFANWPAAGAEHRANLLKADIADLLIGFSADQPQDLFHHLRKETRIRALQCGEPGPFRQVIAGLDIALWDLFARRAGVPLRTFLHPQAPSHVPVYASGIHIDAAAEMIDDARAKGFRNFKVKVGFDLNTDINGIQTLSGTLSAAETLAADANQAWDVKTTQLFAKGVGANDLQWLEEPIPAFSSLADWTELAATVPIPLAAGENIAGYDDFDRVLANRHLKVVQPDLMKWGGVTGSYDIAGRILAQGARYCPHYLGGAIGLAASAELLAAAGGDGVLEVDVNANPLREAFDVTQDRLRGPLWQCDAKPGLGIETLPDELDRYVSVAIEI